MRLLVCGSRGFASYSKLASTLDKIVSKVTEDITVISGTARGADTMAERWAEERGHQVSRHPADWGLHGLRAGMIRNQEMVDTATHVVAFWDGESRGTEHTILMAKNAGLPLRVIEVGTVSDQVNLLIDRLDGELVEEG